MMDDKVKNFLEFSEKFELLEESFYQIRLIFEKFIHQKVIGKEKVKFYENLIKRIDSEIKEMKSIRTFLDDVNFKEDEQNKILFVDEKIIEMEKKIKELSNIVL